MTRKFAIGMMLALMMVLSVSVTAMAAGPGPNSAAPAAGGVAGQAAAPYGTFVDEDGDGACDSFIDRVPAMDGAGSQWGVGGQADTVSPGVNWVDEDGDNVCDQCGSSPQDGTGNQYRKGGRWS